MSPDLFPELSILGQVPAERVDAAENRARILTAARKLFRKHGADAVSMDEVAEAAGVGKGTLYRRFGDKAGLAQALLEADEVVLQERMLRGPQPLGPGGPAATRLVAFVDALAELTVANIDIAVVAERREARFDSAPYRLWRTHVALLLREARPDLDPAAGADTVLALVAAETLASMLRSGASTPTIRKTLRIVARSIAGPPAARPTGSAGSSPRR